MFSCARSALGLYIIRHQEQGNRPRQPASPGKVVPPKAGCGRTANVRTRQRRTPWCEPGRFFASSRASGTIRRSRSSTRQGSHHHPMAGAEVESVQWSLTEGDAARAWYRSPTDHLRFWMRRWPRSCFCPSKTAAAVVRQERDGAQRNYSETMVMPILTATAAKVDLSAHHSCSVDGGGRAAAGLRLARGLPHNLAAHAFVLHRHQFSR